MNDSKFCGQLVWVGIDGFGERLSALFVELSNDGVRGGWFKTGNVHFNALSI